MKQFWDIVLKVPDALLISEINQIQNQYNKDGREKMFKEGENRKLLPFLAHILAYVECDKIFWENVHLAYENNNRKILTILDNLFYSFRIASCTSPCVTENFGALLESDNCIACFCSGDVDISADISESEKIRSILSCLGYKKLIRKKYRSDLDQDEYLCPPGFGFTFFINIVWMPVLRERSFTLDQKKIRKWLSVQRKKSIIYKDTSIKILSPEAMLIHCIYHISAGHYYCASPGTKLLSELDRIIRYCRVDWEEVFTKCIDLQIEKRVLISLELTQQILNTPISESFINSIRKYHTRQTKRLIKKLYRRKNGIYIICEPNDIISRFFIDVYSDSKNLLPALFNKVWYIVKTAILKLY